MPVVHAHVYVSGRVQGVGFRYSTCHEAIRLNLVGWVRNLADGRVEAVFEGDEETVRQMVAWCREGPPGARVGRVQVEWEPATGEYSAFEIAPGGW